jgi:phosphatidylglycerophosphate synthase
MLKQDAGIRGFQASMGAALSRIPLSPDSWTLLSVMVAVMAAWTIATGDLLPGLLLFALAGLFDVIDGAVARARGQVTELGGFLDGVADRFVEGIFLFSFMFQSLPEVLIDARIWLSCLIFLGTCMPSFIRAYADHKGVISRERALELSGICERSERLMLVILGLALGILLSMEWFVYGLIAASVLSVVTIAQRLLQIRASYQPKVNA